MFGDLVLRNRSYRRFDESVGISDQTLRALVDLARCSPSASNGQSIKFFLSCTSQQNAKIFPRIGWAGALKDWSGPAEGERPTAYIVILGDTRIAERFNSDWAIAAQTILLGAVEIGLGGCMIGNFPAGPLREDLGLAEHFQPLLIVALGVPAESVTIEPMPASGAVAYWRDPDGGHHVPKRSLDELIVSGE